MILLVRVTLNRVLAELIGLSAIRVGFRWIEKLHRLSYDKDAPVEKRAFRTEVLCNACGIRYRKKRRAVMGLKDRKVAGGTKERRSDSKSDGSNKKTSSSLKMKMLSFGREVIWNQGSFMRNHKQKRMGEEEEAAVLLMAISSGFVYA
ncbi:hypothetical protein HPP92_011108 [Vanilla planifolia]|uniref:Uncharacterized protein n=1 Tax=Vanilla planifolia TaxID=51239 RepID=A0A835V0Q6_VANPL|nr:hypothetical protein HPP92_011108 [Vanilla planifolia]